jgi:hypothetical protein
MVNVKAYGAVGDGVANDASAIQNALDNAVTFGGCAFFPSGNYKINSTLMILCDVSHAQGAILTVDAGVEPGVQIGNGVNECVDLDISIPAVERVSRQWGPAASPNINTDVGVKIEAATACNIHLRKIKDFSIGLLLKTSAPKGISYNFIRPQWLSDNGVQIRIFPSASGWVTENQFYGGRYGQTTGIGECAGARQIEILSGEDPATQPDNNHWFGASLETNVSEYKIYSEGADSLFVGCRWEGNLSGVYWGSGGPGVGEYEALSNTILGGYSSENISVREAVGCKGNRIIRNGDNEYWFGYDNANNSEGVLLLRNGYTSDNSALKIFDVAATLGRSAVSGDWSVNITANDLFGKRRNDANARIRLDYKNGNIYLGQGSSGPGARLYASDNYIVTSGLICRSDGIVNKELLRCWNSTISGSFAAGAQISIGDNDSNNLLRLRQSGDGSTHKSYIIHNATGVGAGLVIQSEATQGNINIETSGNTNQLVLQSDGTIRFNDAFTFPTTDGTSNQVLTTDGAGNVTWEGPGEAASGIEIGADVVGGGSGQLLWEDGTNKVASTSSLRWLADRNTLQTSNLSTDMLKLMALLAMMILMIPLLFKML